MQCVHLSHFIITTFTFTLILRTVAIKLLTRRRMDPFAGGDMFMDGCELESSSGQFLST